MIYKDMYNNISLIIDCLCVNNNFLIDIHKFNNDIEISIYDKKKNIRAYNTVYKNMSQNYDLLINDLIDFFDNDKIAISRLFQLNKDFYQQSIYIDNLEFNTYIDSNNKNEIISAAKRHNDINKIAQKQNTCFKKKTNHKSLIVG